MIQTLVTASQVVSRTVNSGGATVDPFSPMREITSGYGVGGLVPSTVFDARDLLAWDVETFIDTHRESIVPGVAVGAWIDEETGLVHLDLTQVVADREEALRLGRTGSEIAVWDFAAGAEIRL